MPALLLWLGLGGLAAGCGQKGPLTLPASAAVAPSAPGTSAPAR